MCVAIFFRRNSPNLCVFLHGGLKPDNLCALVKVADNWYGIIFPHSDNKKKSCIMLALFDPGPHPVPWLGDLRELGPLAELNATEGLAPFPVKGCNKPSYSSAPVVWIKQERPAVHRSNQDQSPVIRSDPKNDNLFIL